MNMINNAPEQAPTEQAHPEQALSEPLPLFKITHKITREDNRAFQKFGVRYRIISLFIFAFFEILEILLARSAGGLWWIFAFAAVYMAVMLLVRILKVTKAVREKEGREGEILFYENCFVDTFGNEDCAVNYDCCEVYEYGGRFIFMAGRNEGFVFAVSEFGNEEENFREFLRGKFGGKFRERKK